MFTASPWMIYPQIMHKPAPSWVFRMPTQEDGLSIHELIAQCAPLDQNSTYCNFLQSSHFQTTCLIAEQQALLVGFVSAYRKPDKPNELFIWQVAVHPSARGKGLAYQMLTHLLAREDLADISVLETTITQSNQASWRLFQKLDREQGEQGSVSTFLDETCHFEGEHDTEYLYHIPLHSSNLQKG
ncbi:diaminobutyrate acetyltransferase [Vibrio metoecus]|uniref:diaminobutyrate acetyltransferase n=1 Tax=Vibrio metoecus TaxID=1481663 RepID=UPI0014829043|nr:diaminobutyrate acetyltransferase [Vibrio metoecus]